MGGPCLTQDGEEDRISPCLAGNGGEGTGGARRRQRRGEGRQRQRKGRVERAKGCPSYTTAREGECEVVMEQAKTGGSPLACDGEETGEGAPGAGRGYIERGRRRGRREHGKVEGVRCWCGEGRLLYATARRWQEGNVV